MRRIVTMLGALVAPFALGACAMTQPQPPGPDTGEPAFVCGQCDGTTCKGKWLGSQCKDGEDDTGRFCTSHGKCIFGIPLPVVAFSLASDTLLPPKDGAALAAEERINRYFRNEVIPKLRPCWQGLKGTGVVTMQHDYIRRAGGPWVPHGVTMVRSSLPARENAAALKCMDQAARNTALAPDPWDETATDLSLVWAWPVPYPK